MSQKKFIIIFPTRNRLDTLKSALESVLIQRYDNFYVVISDNSDNDETERYITGLSNSRIIYYKTGGSLSMTENWNFALSKISDDDAFITIMGDDDALSINCLAKLNTIINNTELSSYVCSWAYYRWNNLEKGAGILSFNHQKGYEIRNSISDFKEVLNSKREYTQVPHVYTGGFVKFKELLKIKKGSEFLGSVSPDVYSSVGLSLNVGEYVYIKDNLVLCGTSAKSNSAAICGLVSSDEIFKEFTKKNIHKITPFFIDADLKNITFNVLDSYFYYQGNESQLLLAPRTILINALKRGVFDYRNSIRLVRDLLHKNHLKPINIFDAINICFGILLGSIKKIYNYFLTVRVDTKIYSIFDIRQATIFMEGSLFSRNYGITNKVIYLLYKINHLKD